MVLLSVHEIRIMVHIYSIVIDFYSIYIAAGGALLLDRDALGQITRKIDGATTLAGSIIGEQLDS